MTALIKTDVPRVAARANWGRWIVDCPRVPTHALAMNPGEDLFTCWNCGQLAEVVWPAEGVREAIERLLTLRPDESTRNWQPGETLHNLMQENADHGLYSIPGHTGLVLAVDDRGIVHDRLPIPTRALTEVTV